MEKTEFNPVYRRLAGTELFSGDMNAPLAEQGDNVVQFELTSGCSHGRCTYCDLYGEQSFFKKSPEKFKDHVYDVMTELKQRKEFTKNSIKRRDEVKKAVYTQKTKRED